MSFYNARKAANLTQAQAADLIGVTDATISQWENGETRPKTSRLAKVAEVYGCTIDELLKED